jgi:hypothetical protein
LNYEKNNCYCYYSDYCNIANAQNNSADSILNEMGKVKTDSSHIRLMNEIIYNTNSLSQQERKDYSKKILDLAKKQNDTVLESVPAQFHRRELPGYLSLSLT